MYMTPGTPSGGGLWPISACTHLAAFASMHIGSGPGVCGSSGMHVHPFFPGRSVFIAPEASAAMIVASRASAAGAADSALAIGSLLASDATFLVSADAVPPFALLLLQPLAAKVAAVSSNMIVLLICPSLVRKDRRISTIAVSSHQSRLIRSPHFAT